MRNRLFRIDRESKVLEELVPSGFCDEGFVETKDLHEWLAGYPGLLGEDFLIIQREHVNVQGSRRRPDILAIDKECKLVVVEVKRDDAGDDIYWQAALYVASYWPRSGADIIELYADYAGIERGEAVARLLKHTSSEDEADLLTKLNAKQRLVLVARTFSREVTTTVLWLREQGVDISCLQLVLYPDRQSGTYYIESRYVIPVPETKDLLVELRKTQEERADLKESIAARQNDEVTRFMRAVSERLSTLLTTELRPDRLSRWAGIYGSIRYFKFWYGNRPWQNHYLCFAVDLETAGNDPHNGQVYAYFAVAPKQLTEQGLADEVINALRQLVDELRDKDGFEMEQDTDGSFYLGKWVSARELSQVGVNTVADVLAELIQRVVPRAQSLLKREVE